MAPGVRFLLKTVVSTVQMASPTPLGITTWWWPRRTSSHANQATVLFDGLELPATTYVGMAIPFFRALGCKIPSLRMPMAFPTGLHLLDHLATQWRGHRHRNVPPAGRTGGCDHSLAPSNPSVCRFGQRGGSGGGILPGKGAPYTSTNCMVRVSMIIVFPYPRWVYAPKQDGPVGRRGPTASCSPRVKQTVAQFNLNAGAPLHAGTDTGYSPAEARTSLLYGYHPCISTLYRVRAVLRMRMNWV